MYTFWDKDVFMILKDKELTFGINGKTYKILYCVFGMYSIAQFEGGKFYNIPIHVIYLFNRFDLYK